MSRTGRARCGFLIAPPDSVLQEVCVSLQMDLPVYMPFVLMRLRALSLNKRHGNGWCERAKLWNQ